ncbi:hypothetical protein JKP88DRAFT_280369 [Tribonema minus]|uniref:Uncharacterized protein n=1 Tax=Tribonema minus TaxID=303371 RepID=A0A836CCV8_9STRA|nr:hypothetical protein JKP88DRAFT_280369 [Tribonema minus]
MPPKSRAQTASPPEAAAQPAAAPPAAVASATPGVSSGVEAELSNAAQAIAKVEGKIDAVEEEITDVKGEIKEKLKGKGEQDGEQAGYLGMTVLQLQDYLKVLNEQLNALMREKGQLRDKEAKLMDRQVMRPPDAPGELLIQLLGPQPSETDKSFDW